MPIPDDVAYAALALHLAADRGEIDDEGLVRGLAAIAAEVETQDDVLDLLVRVTALAAGATKVAALRIGASAEDLLQAALYHHTHLGGDHRSTA